MQRCLALIEVACSSEALMHNSGDSSCTVVQLCKDAAAAMLHVSWPCIVFVLALLLGTVWAAHMLDVGSCYNCLTHPLLSNRPHMGVLAMQFPFGPIPLTVCPVMPVAAGPVCLFLALQVTVQ